MLLAYSYPGFGFGSNPGQLPNIKQVSFTVEKKLTLFWEDIRYYYFFIPIQNTSQLQKKPPAFQREHLTL
jgi:hypothetical protein